MTPPNIDNVAPVSSGNSTSNAGEAAQNGSPSSMSSPSGNGLMFPTMFSSVSGSQTLTPPSFFAAHRDKLLEAVAAAASRQHEETRGVLYLQGGKEEMRNDSDHELLFRQESYFHYLFGVRDPDYEACLHVPSGKAVLFIPRLPMVYATFMGHIKTTEEVREEYGVDEVHYCEDLPDYLEKALGDNERDKLLLLKGLNSDSKTWYDRPPTSLSEESPLWKRVDDTLVFPILAECRVHKDATELQLLRHVAEISSMAHVYVMRHIHPGMMEYQCESLFRHYCLYNHGARIMGYTPICGCGPNAAILHYGHAAAPNDGRIMDGALCLHDMGAELRCYGSDITCTFPANGSFTEHQRIVYEGVLNAQRAVLAMLRPGVSWVDCHKAAEVEILRALRSLGVVVVPEEDGTATPLALQDLVELRLGAVFMPHGLGHFIGIDTHDVGGYLEGHPPRLSDQAGLSFLRTSRIMEADMVLTVEPGCYFIRHLLEQGLADAQLSRFLNADLLRSNFMDGWGGVRLEDVVVVTETACENLTVCPRTVEEVQHVMAGGKWPPLADKAPELKRKRLTNPNPLWMPAQHFS